MSEQVREMFADIAPDYDRANTVLSLGVHRRWRKKAVKLARAKRGHRVLDCATGTGDLAFAFAEVVGRAGLVVGSDFCRDMVARAPAKAQREGHVAQFQVSDALRLPFADHAFDIASIGFGIRNVDDPVACLREMARVVRPGGRVVVLEFGQPQGALAKPYELYSRHVIPRVGGMLTGNRAAYEYLPRTSAAFPAGDDFLRLMDDAGAFEERRASALTRGIAYVYVGVVK